MPFEVAVDGERYTALAVPTAPGVPLVAMTLQSRDQALAPYRLIQGGLLVLGLVAIVAGIGGSAMLARSITRPVARLVQGTREVAAGNFEFELAVERDDELGDLAASFNTMTRGLRERAAMAKFVSHSTVEMIQSAERRPESHGERRTITVFFSDIRGFTALAERLAPEAAVALLNQCLSVQAEIVARFGGDVDKFIGDAVFAHFDGQDMAVNAIRCGVEIHHAMARLTASHPDTPIELGIGIATGEVILGSIGSADRLDYTALGSTVNLCARLCGAAGPTRDPAVGDDLRGRARLHRRRPPRSTGRQRLCGASPGLSHGRARPGRRLTSESPLSSIRLCRVRLAELVGVWRIDQHALVHVDGLKGRRGPGDGDLVRHRRAAARRGRYPVSAGWQRQRVAAVAVGDGHKWRWRHDNHRRHLRVDVAEHPIRGCLRKDSALGRAGTVKSQIERRWRGQREHVVEDRILVWKRDRRADWHSQDAGRKCLVLLCQREGRRACRVQAGRRAARRPPPICAGMPAEW